MKLRPHSFATADANSVFPHPGNPYNNNPERNLSGQVAKIAPYLVGHSSVSRNTRRVSCRPPMSAHWTLDFCNLTSRSERGTNPVWAVEKSSSVSSRACGLGRQSRVEGGEGGTNGGRRGGADGGLVDGAVDEVAQVGGEVAFSEGGDGGVVERRGDEVGCRRFGLDQRAKDLFIGH